MTNGFTPRRNSLRYPGQDYASPVLTFFTICTYERLRLFGTAVEGSMGLNNVGIMVSAATQAIPERHAGVALKTLVMMPDHIPRS